MFGTLKMAYNLATLAVKVKTAHTIVTTVSDLIPESVKKRAFSGFDDIKGQGQETAMQALEKYAPDFVDQLKNRNKKDEPVTKEQVQDMLAQVLAAQKQPMAVSAKPKNKRALKA